MKAMDKIKKTLGMKTDAEKALILSPEEQRLFPHQRAKENSRQPTYQETRA